MAQPTLTWAYLTRARSEHDLIEELGADALPEEVGEGVVASAGRPNDPERGLLDPAFARQAMRLDGPPCELHPELLADRVAAAMRAHAPARGPSWTWAMQVLAPDSSDPHDPRRKAVEAILSPLHAALGARLSDPQRAAEVSAKDAERLVQVWALDETQAIVGVTLAQHAISRVPGGKVRMKRPVDAPSRSGLKLEEAIQWIGLGPEKGDICADLGAAPGGWSQVAVQRGAIVIAIDPARIKIALPSRQFTHVQESAFSFAPAETLDWVLCDMAWRPMEVAALLAKWARRGWARQMIANFKLPMKKKAEILAQVLAQLSEAGWRGLRARQLYFDRDEVTLFGWLDAGLVRKGAQAPFSLRAHEGRSPKEIAARRKMKEEGTTDPRIRGKSGRTRGRGGRGARPGGRTTSRGRGRPRGRR